MTTEQHQKVCEIFLAAADLPEGERTPFLREKCGDDAELLREVEALLEHHDPSPLIRDEGSHSLVELLELPLRMVSDDRYEIGDEVARGGMGVILRAHDNEIGRKVAIKVLREGLEVHPEILTRFVAEAQIAGQLQHPGIAPVYEVGELPDDRPFFAMELVDGECFSAILADRTLTAADQSRLLGIFEQICQTMAYAHSRGVIHRDLKPANVIVGVYGQVQILDWGLAKVLSTGNANALDLDTLPHTVRNDDDSSHGLSETRMGTGMGTRGYAPPEQARGDFADVDRRSDVFSLGAILCEILTGDPALPKSDTSNKLADATTVDQGEVFARLDDCEADSLLVDLAKACLSSEANDRLDDADVVAKRISEYQLSVQSRLKEAELATAKAEAKASEERKRRLLTIGLATAAILLGVVGFTAWNVVSAAKHQQQIEQERRKNLVTQSINDALTDAVRLREIARATPLTSVQPWSRALEAAQRADEFVKDHMIDPALEQKVAETLTSLEKETTNRQFFADIATARIQADNAPLGFYGGVYMQKRFTAAFAHYNVEPVKDIPEEAAEVVRVACGQSLEEVITIANQWWLFDPRGNKTNEVGKWIREFVDALDGDPWRRRWRDEIGRTNNNREAILAIMHEPTTLERPVGDIVNLAQGLMRTRNPWVGEIVEFLQRAEKRHPKSVWLKYWIAGYATRLTSPESIQKGLRYSQTLVLLHPTAASRVLHARLLRQSGDVDEAETELNAVLAMHPRNLEALREMSRISMQRSEWQLVLDYLDKVNAVASDLKSLDPNLGNRSDTSLGMRAAVYRKLGRHEEAVRIYQTLVQQQPLMRYKNYKNLGEAYHEMGEHEKAITSLEKVEPKNGQVWLLLGRAQLANGDASRAETALTKAIKALPNRSEAHLLLGRAHWEQHQWREAVESYRTGFNHSSQAREKIGHLTKAARSAVLAAGQPSSPAANTGERDQLFRLGRVWLRAVIDHASTSETASNILAGYLKSPEFSAVRDTSQLASLSRQEREAWTKLWKDVRGVVGEE